MFSQAILNKLKSGFKKGKLKGLSNIDPKRLSLSFDGYKNNGQMKIDTARVRLDQKEVCSFGFGKVPKKSYGIMFTVTANPQGYELSIINKKLKKLKVKAVLSAGQLLLLIRLNSYKDFFDGIDKLVEATSFLS